MSIADDVPWTWVWKVPTQFISSLCAQANTPNEKLRPIGTGPDENFDFPGLECGPEIGSQES